MSGSGSSAQFRDYDTPWKREGSNFTSYHVTDSRNSDPTAPGLSLEVEHPKTEYALNFREEDSAGVTFSGDHNTSSERWQTGDGHGRQRSLFNVWHTKPRVSALASHPDFRGHVGTMLGVAAVETKNRFRESPVASNDLSEQSSRIVHRLAESGAIEAPGNEQRNSLSSGDFSNYAIHNRGYSLYGLGGEIKESGIPRSTVAMGRHTMREILRGPKRQISQTVSGVSEKAKGKQERMF